MTKQEWIAKAAPAFKAEEERLNKEFYAVVEQRDKAEKEHNAIRAMDRKYPAFSETARGREYSENLNYLRGQMHSLTTAQVIALKAFGE